jgi:flagellar biosynthesis protein FlhG
MIPLGEAWQLMASPAALEAIEELDNLKLKTFILSLKQIFNQYSLVIVDTPSASIDIISPLVEIADVNLIVVNPELTSLADGFGLYKYLLRCRRNSEVYLFLNRAGSAAEALYIYQKFTLLAQKFLNKVPLSGGYMLDDRHIIDAIARQKTLCELNPESPAVRSLHRLLKISTDLPAAGWENRTINKEERINLKKALADIKE